MKPLGEIFSQARAAKGLPLAQAAEITKIKIQTLAAIEANDFSRMPAPLYARGFIKLYAECLGLDPAPLIEEYNRMMAAKPSLNTHWSEIESQRSLAMRKILGGPTVDVPAAPAPSSNNAAGLSEAMPVGAPAETPATPFRLQADETVPESRQPREETREPTPPAALAARPATRTQNGPPRHAGGRREFRDLGLKVPRLSPEIMSALRRYIPIGVALLVVIILLVSGLNRFASHRSKARTAAASTPVPAKIRSDGLRLALEPPPPYISGQR
jgi:transcriptional regulator with XRE-family HTH domain